MSPKCASMLEAQRSADDTIRRLPSFAELRRNYQEQCGENQSDARRRWYEDQRKAQQETLSQERDKKKQEYLDSNAAKLKVSQCQEMRRSLDSRKQRANLSEGDQRDLKLFESRYQERCP
jgi:hypothetical protein